MTGNTSEVARLTAQITAECQAASQGLEGYACMARHEIIRTRLERVHATSAQLIEHIGQDAALPLIVAAMEGK